MKHTSFPDLRARRLRTNKNLRAMVRETKLSVDDFLYPIFVKYGNNLKSPISSMPAQYQFSIDKLEDEILEVVELGIPAIMLFGIPDSKDWCGSENFDPDGLIPTAIRKIKDIAPDLIVVSDMCYCEYTDHGHCGIINTPDHEYYQDNVPEGYLLNDPTLEYLGKASVVHARAGADIIAPSGMIDGMVQKIRKDLDDAGYPQTTILSYAAKFASNFYGPFRDAAESPPSFGNRDQYQMDPSNAREALKEVDLDVEEGADMLMVKPALPYLDIITKVRDRHNLPIAAYQVSGEYAMIHAAAENGWIDLEKVALESLLSIKRAGADIILTYFAKQVAKILEEN